MNKQEATNLMDYYLEYGDKDVEYSLETFDNVNYEVIAYHLYDDEWSYACLLYTSDAADE